MNVATTVTREAIATGLGLGAAATAALFSCKGDQAELVTQLPVQDVSQALQMESILREVQALEQDQQQLAWDQEYAAKRAEGILSDDFVALPSDMSHAWDESLSRGQQQQWTEEFGGMVTGETTSTVASISAADFMTSVEQRLHNQETQLASDWANEFEFEFNPNTTSDNWANEFASGQDQRQEDFLHKLQSQWDQQLAEDEAHSWLTPTTDSLFNQEYKFSPDNLFLSSSTPLADGRRLVEQGNIPQAVLAFEAAVQKDANDPEAWVALGKTQAQNEQDSKAITALNQALKIQPQNLSAILALGASLTNEAFQLQAAQTLKNWLFRNPKYSHLVPSGSQPVQPSRLSSVVSKDELKSIQDSFVEAARLNPHKTLDPDVQSGLGILFNLGNDHEKAADCFRAALSLRPNDSLLWNRLGATLANGGKPAEAIGAFRRALELSPGFIRTRVNLGISCSNLGAHKEAADHFLTALNQQASANESSLMSNSIWSTLRMVLNLMGRGDLLPVVDSRNLPKLNHELKLN